MIYLAYISEEQALYALYGEVRLKCVDTESSGVFIQGIINRAMATTSAEQQQAHFWPEHRRICWCMKIPHTEQGWCDLLDHGTVLD